MGNPQSIFSLKQSIEPLVLGREMPKSMSRHLIGLYDLRNKSLSFLICNMNMNDILKGISIHLISVANQFPRWKRDIRPTVRGQHFLLWNTLTIRRGNDCIGERVILVGIMELPIVSIRVPNEHEKMHVLWFDP